MKRRRQPPSPHLKRQYNIVHRLRLQGVSVDTVGNAINIATEDEYNALDARAKKYIHRLQSDYRFAIQTYIPGGYRDDTPPPAIKFTRKKRPMTTQDAADLIRWPPCPLQLPERIRLGMHGEITNVPRFLSLHISRLDSPSPLLARLSRQALDEFIEIITDQPSTP